MQHRLYFAECHPLQLHCLPSYSLVPQVPNSLSSGFTGTRSTFLNNPASGETDGLRAETLYPRPPSVHPYREVRCYRLYLSLCLLQMTRLQIVSFLRWLRSSDDFRNPATYRDLAFAAKAVVALHIHTPIASLRYL